MSVPATPQSPPQQQQVPRQDRNHSPPAAVREGSTEGMGEGWQGLYSSHDKQAWCRGAGRGGQGTRHQGRRCPSRDLGVGWRKEAGEQGRSKRGFARSTSGLQPGPGVGGRQGQRLRGGRGGGSHLHTSRKSSLRPLQSPCWPRLSPRPHGKCPAPLFTE